MFKSETHIPNFVDSNVTSVCDFEKAKSASSKIAGLNKDLSSCDNVESGIYVDSESAVTGGACDSYSDCQSERHSCSEVYSKTSYFFPVMNNSPHQEILFFIGYPCTISFDIQGEESPNNAEIYPVLVIFIFIGETLQHLKMRRNLK